MSFTATGRKARAEALSEEAVARACSGDDPSVRFNTRNSVNRLSDRSNTALTDRADLYNEKWMLIPRVPIYFSGIIGHHVPIP